MSSRPTQVIRGDDPRLFGPGTRVRAAKLFPLPASYTPGFAAIPFEDPELDALYDDMAELLARDDALDPESATAAAIAELEERMRAREARQAEAMRAAFEDDLHMPLGTGAELSSQIAEALDRAHPGPDDTTT